MSELTRNHFYLIEMAKNLIAKRFKEGHHHTVSALRTRAGKMYVGIQVKSRMPKATICAEAAAIASAACEGDVDIESIVVINRYGRIIPPCGVCRELILEYSPDAEVIVPGSSGGKPMAIEKLLPIPCLDPSSEK